MARPLLIVLVGPTAIGKTAAAIKLAKVVNAEIISADSRQFFKELSIGTARQTAEECAEVPHHFTGFLSIHDEYSAGDFERDVITFLDTYFRKNEIAVMTGGSGLYVKAILEGFDELPADEAERAKLNLQLQTSGIESLQEELKMRDPVHYKVMDINNPQRLIRALEVCRISGQKYSDLRQSSTVTRNFDVLQVGISAPREVIYNRIDERVDQMITAGLVEEAKSVASFKHLNALNTVGYKELFEHFDGVYDLPTAVEKIKQHTRNFAKRQLTWFRKNSEIQWFDYRDINEMIVTLREHINQRMVN